MFLTIKTISWMVTEFELDNTPLLDAKCSVSVIVTTVDFLYNEWQ
jgi:hypothetical protein